MIKLKGSAIMSKKLKIIIGVIAVLVIGGYFGISYFMSHVEANLNQLVDMKVSGIDLEQIEDGAYTGNYRVFPITVEVQVTVEEHQIIAINLIKHQNGQGKPAEAIIGKVVESQTLQIDSIAGATYSSKVILKAIENALLDSEK